MTITIASGNNNLSGLITGSGALSPAFSPSITAYTTTVDHSVDGITVTASTSDSIATIKTNNITTTSGVASNTISLNVGSNTLNIEVTAQDGSIKNYTITVTREGAPTPTPQPTSTPEIGASVIVNGKIENTGTIIDKYEGEKKTTTIVVDEQKLNQRLTDVEDHALVTVLANTNADLVISELNGQMIKNMENKKIVLEIKTEKASYTLPVQQLNIDAISKQMGINVALTDIKVQIEISKSAKEMVRIVEDSANKGNFIIVTPPLEFTIHCTHNNKVIEISTFNAYVERTIIIPDGIDPQKITTGIIIDTNGTTRHVPTKIVKIDGKFYAKINSLTNSTYSVIYNPRTFTDTQTHWAKDDINDMASRMIISGVTSDLFEPNSSITRAEFIAIIVSGLGLKSGTGINPFNDVKSSEWYTPFVETAFDYGIISGYSDDVFGPMDTLTREQSITIITRAMTITNLTVNFEGDELKELLATFSDSNQFASWSKESLASCIKTGIVLAKDGKTLAPLDKITRAEVAVMIKRLLEKSNLI